MSPCSLDNLLLQVSPFCECIDIMDDSLVDKIKLISWVMVCVAAFQCILVIAQLDDAFDLQPAPNIYAVWYFIIKIRPIILPSAIQFTIASSYHPITDNNTIKLDQLVNFWDFKVMDLGA